MKVTNLYGRVATKVTLPCPATHCTLQCTWKFHSSVLAKSELNVKLGSGNGVTLYCTVPHDITPKHRATSPTSPLSLLQEKTRERIVVVAVRPPASIAGFATRVVIPSRRSVGCQETRC